MEENREKCVQLAHRIYELDEKVYTASGSSLGRTFSGEQAHNIENLTLLVMTNPQGHILRSEVALIGNMARSIRDKSVRHGLLVEYNAILKEIESLPKSFGSVDIVDKDLADMNSSLLNKNFSFKVKESQGAAWRYAALALGVLIVTTLLFGWLNHFIPAHHEGLSLLLKGAIDIVLYFVNYRIQRNWVFKEKSCKNETECA